MHSISRSDILLIKLYFQVLKSGSMSALSRNLQTIDELSTTRYVCCDSPSKFVRLLGNKHSRYVSTDDLVSAGNSRDLLFLREKRTTRSSTMDLNCLLENVSTF